MNSLAGRIRVGAIAIMGAIAAGMLAFAILIASRASSSAPRPPGAGSRERGGNSAGLRQTLVSAIADRVGEGPAAAPSATNHSPHINFAKLPMSFEPNLGQSDPQVKFVSRGLGYTLFITPGETVIAIRQSAPDGVAAAPAPSPAGILISASRKRLATSPVKERARDGIVRIALKGAATSPQIEGIDRMAGKSNYFIGNDPKRWHTDVPNYAGVELKNVYPGIDLIYHGGGSLSPSDLSPQSPLHEWRGDGGVVSPSPFMERGSGGEVSSGRQLEYDFRVAPGADPNAIRLSFKGGNKLALDKRGDLVVKVGKSRLLEHAPVIYQEIGGKRRTIAGGWKLHGAHEAGFRVADYDRGKPLMIDPVLLYSTYLGGSGGDQGSGIAVDSSGNAYVTGYAFSTNFPILNAYQSANAGSDDAFVAKLNPAASGAASLLYSTYLGGIYSDQGNGIAVDSSGNAYVTGWTDSPGNSSCQSAGTPFPCCTGIGTGSCVAFPLVNAFQITLASGGGNAFVAKLNSTGNALVYSTYLGGSGGGGDQGFGIAVDSSGNAYVTGATWSSDFPTKNAYQGTYGGLGNAFVAKLNPAASGAASLLYSTYLGGSGGDQGNGIATDSSGNAYVTGFTGSTDFPTKNGYQSADAGGLDAFVAKLNPAVSGSASLLYSTYLGGSSSDQGNGIAVDPSGNAYVTGAAQSANFPLLNAYQSANNGGSNGTVFVSKLNPAAAGAASLLYSTYLGGSGGDTGRGIAADSAGNAYVTGSTSSTNFPTLNAYQGANAGGYDAFVAKLNPAASGAASLIYSTYLGGSSSDQGYGIATDSAGSAYVTGSTSSTNFPTLNAYQGTLGGSSSNVFVTKLSPANPGATPTATVTPSPATTISPTVTISPTATPAGPTPTRTATPTATVTVTPIATGPTPTLTATPTGVVTVTATSTGPTPTLTATPTPTSAAAGPWPMFHHDAQHTGLSQYNTSADDGTLKWAFPNGGGAGSAPAIGADGTIYVGSGDSNLYAINPADGTKKWQVSINTYGVSSSPAIGADGTIYVMSDDNYLHAFNPADGSPKWKSSQSIWLAAGAPTVGPDGTIYISDQYSDVYAINPADGSLKWASSGLSGSFGFSYPAISPDGATVYLGDGQYGVFYALNSADGTEKWQLSAGGAIHSAPAVAADGTIYFGSDDGNLYAITDNGISGTQKWTPIATGGLVQSSPAIGPGGTVYVTAAGHLIAVNPDSSVKWAVGDGEPGPLQYQFTNLSPAIGAEGTIYAWAYGGIFVAVNPDGTLKWTYTIGTGELANSPPAIGANGVIYAGGGWAGGGGVTHLFALGACVICPTATTTATPTATATVTFTATPTGPSPTATVSPTVTATPTATATPAPTPTPTPYAPWAMFQHDLFHSGLSQYDTTTNTGALRWKFPAGGGIVGSSPAIGADGTIYTGSSDGNLYAAKPDGNLKWKFATGNQGTSSPAIGPDGTIYTGSSDGNVYAITDNGSSGANKWPPLPTGGPVNSSPAIGPDGTIYVGSDDNNLYAVNPAGGIRWKFTTTGAVESSPAIGLDGTIYVGSGDNNLYAINPNGLRKWAFPTGGPVNSSPSIGPDGTIYIGSDDGHLYAVTDNGPYPCAGCTPPAQKWKFTTTLGGAIRTTAAIGPDGTIYTGSPNNLTLYALDPASGLTKWPFATGGYILSSPAIGADGTIFVTPTDGTFYAITPGGSLKWMYQVAPIHTQAALASSPAIGADGTVYINSGDGNLYAMSSVCLAPGPSASITQIFPTSGGNAGPVTVTAQGRFCQAGPTVKLSTSGQPDIVATNVTISTDGTALNATFDLTGAAAGARDFVVTNPDSSGATLPGSFTVLSGGAPNLWVEVLGRDTVRGGSPATFNIAFGNSGTQDAYFVPLWISFDSSVSFKLLTPLTPVPQISGDPPIDFSGVPISSPSMDGSQTLIPLLLPVVSAGASYNVSIQLTGSSGFNLQAVATTPLINSLQDLNPSSAASLPAGSAHSCRLHAPGGLNAAVPLGSLPPGCLSSLASNIAKSLVTLTGIVFDPTCIRSALRLLYSLEYVILTPPVWTGHAPPPVIFSLNHTQIMAILKVIRTGVTCVIGSIPIVKLINLTIRISSIVYNLTMAGIDCYTPQTAFYGKRVTVAGAEDPNAIAGPIGLGTQQWVPAGKPLHYSVFFTNDATATLPAQKVVVTNQLDPTKFDLTTLSLGSIAFGNQIVTPPPGRTSYSTTVDLRPAQTLAVNISAALNQTTGLVTWSYSSIDPTTGQPPTDPMVGFLPPDTAPPNGEGYVTYNVNSLGSIPNATAINNQATVVFDANAPINTNVWTNTASDLTQGGVSTVAPSPLNFKPAKVSSSKKIAATLSIRNTSTTTLTGNIGTPSAPFTLISTIPADGSFTLAAGKKIALKVGIPAAQAGLFSGNLGLLTSDPNNQEISVPLIASVYAPKPLTITPKKSINFGTVTVGSSASQPVTATNPNSTAVAVSVGVSAAGFSPDAGCDGMLAAGASCTANVTFSPTAAGNASAVLNFADDAAKSPQHIGLSGTGQ